MKYLHPSLVAICLAAAALVAVPAQAQADATAQAQAQAADMSTAEVRKVDKENRKITLKHGEIKNLDMPPMTMVFSVNDAALLDKVKAGDKVRFRATQDAGKYTVTELQPAN